MKLGAVCTTVDLRYAQVDQVQKLFVDASRFNGFGKCF